MANSSEPYYGGRLRNVCLHDVGVEPGVMTSCDEVPDGFLLCDWHGFNDEPDSEYIPARRDVETAFVTGFIVGMCTFLAMFVGCAVVASL